MPLSCDCYSGCWAEHSKTWKKVLHRSEAEAQAMFRGCVQVLRYGTYVRYGLEVRLEDPKDVRVVRRHLGRRAENYPNQSISSVV